MKKELEAFREQIQKCSHCSFCQATCPVFLKDLVETHMPRARMEIARATLLDETLALTKNAKKILDRCLLCGQCSNTCPGGVKVDDIVAAARADMTKGRGKRPLARLVENRFMQKRGNDIVASCAVSLGRMVGLLPEEVGAPTFDSFVDRKEEFHPAQGEKRGTVIYYVGCATNSVHMDTATCVVNVLTRNGFDVVMPKGLVCCGMPALARGDLETARSMLYQNMEILAGQDVDAVVTDCTTCGMMLRDKSPGLLAEKMAPDKILGVAWKTWEALDYLAAMGLTAQPGPMDVTITYHEPCHRHWTPTLADAPRKVLGQIPGLVFKEMADPGRCCGAGGGFFLENRELSTALRQERLDQIKDTRAEVTITQCPVCRSFLDAPKTRCRVVHPVSILAASYSQVARKQDDAPNL